MIREYSITFHAPIVGTGRAAVHFWLEKLGTTSADYRFRFLSEDGAVVHAEGRRVNICLDPATMRPAPWSADARTLVKALLKTALTTVASSRSRPTGPHRVGGDRQPRPR